MKTQYEANSLSLTGAVAMGTGVMIGAGIFALTGQVAQSAGALFPWAFLVAAIISGFSAYSYIKMSNAFPSAGGIAMYLRKAYGEGTVTGAAALLMAVSMVISESLVARTFGAYTMRLFSVEGGSIFVPILAVALVFFAFLVNIAGNTVIGPLQKVTATIKIGGILIFALAALWISDLPLGSVRGGSVGERGPASFLAGVALAILAYKGFTTITNSGGEVKDPHKNVSRAIVISLGICVVVYMAVALAVGASLSIPEIIAARDYSLAEASRPLLGNYGMGFTVIIAVIATTSGIIASMFAVSRMLAMLTEMQIIPHRHFGMPGSVQKHTLVFTAILAGLLAGFFDLSRIASLGAVFYLVMDIIVHWGVLRHVRKEVQANPIILVSAIVLDLVVLGAFLWVKGQADLAILWIAFGGIGAVFAFEHFFLRKRRPSNAHREHEPMM
ncbi:APC family permease [Sphingobium sp. BS19]|uniref:APC family permease n=1 Tax=Sphingobium sp. BS19 TaxID=3018973 RepID=UPI0022EE6910|nr:amino acid permease [Sphingobium sp. BS19]